MYRYGPSTSDSTGDNRIKTKRSMTKYSDKENRILEETQLSKRNKDGDANNYLFLYHTM